MKVSYRCSARVPVLYAQIPAIHLDDPADAEKKKKPSFQIPKYVHWPYKTTRRWTHGVFSSIMSEYMDQNRFYPS